MILERRSRDEDSGRADRNGRTDPFAQQNVIFEHGNAHWAWGRSQTIGGPIILSGTMVRTRDELKKNGKTKDIHGYEELWLHHAENNPHSEGSHGIVRNGRGIDSAGIHDPHDK